MFLSSSTWILVGKVQVFVEITVQEITSIFEEVLIQVQIQERNYLNTRISI